MSTKQHQRRSISDYDEATVHLLSAFFSVIGHTPEDQQVRDAIEAALAQLNRAELAAARSNIVQFCRLEVRAGY